MGLRLKGENGIMKKKFICLQKDIEDQREEIKQLFEHKKELYQVHVHKSFYLFGVHLRLNANQMGNKMLLLEGVGSIQCEHDLFLPVSLDICVFFWGMVCIN